MDYNGQETSTAITSDELIAELKPILKDLFVAKVQENSDGAVLKFLNGQSFTVAIWENKDKY